MAYKNKPNNCTSIHLSDYRTQAAIEYLATYGWALLIIAIASVLLYTYVLAPSASAPNTCLFNTGVAYCRDAIFSSNSVGSTVVIIISNQQQYPIANPEFLINTQNTGNVTGSCIPGYTLASAAVVCNAILPNAYGQGTLVSSLIYFKETTCVTGSTIKTCSGGTTQTIKGSLVTHVQPSLSQTP